jgi:membrane-associated protein
VFDFPSLDVHSFVSYAVALFVPTFDAVLPILPSEAVVVALGVATAGSTDPRLALLVAAAALGAFLGDNISYLLGRHFGPRVEKRFFTSSRGRKRLAWAERGLERYGGPLIIGCRFVPGGRTAVTVSCGLLAYPRGRFVGSTAVAGVIWATYAFLIGRLGGRAFADRPWYGLILAFAVVLALSGVVEVVRRARTWYRSRTRAREPV